MMKTILLAIGFVSFAGVANAEVVALKTKHFYDSQKKETVIDFSTKACGIKAISFGLDAHQISYIQYSQVVASYKTAGTWGVERDIFNNFGMVMAGEQSPWFELSGKEDCLRKVYITGQITLWPTSQGHITIYGEK